MHDGAGLGWRKSSRSSGYDNCVEIAQADDGTVSLRDSKNPAQGILRFNPNSWHAFLAAVKADEFDLRSQ